MENPEIAQAFDEVADLLELQGANPFRVRAYRNAARTIRDLAEPAAEIAADPGRRLEDLPGIGADLAGKIRTLFQTGDLPLRQQLRAEVPAGLRDLLGVPGLGLKRAQLLYQRLGIRSLDRLRQAAQEHRIRQVKGFGTKTEENILRGLEHLAQVGRRVYLAEAKVYADALIRHLKAAPGLRQVEVAGSVRRRQETVGDLDVLVACDDASKVMDWLAAYDGVVEVLGRGDTKMTVRLKTGLQIEHWSARCSLKSAVGRRLIMKALALALLGGLATGFLAPVRAEEKQALVPSLTVVGAGKVSARPDMAQIQLGVVTEAPSATKALKDNSDAMARLFATLDGRGVARKDVQTSNFSVTPQYKRGPHGEQLPEVVGYRVSNAVQVKVRKLDALGQVLDEVVQQGANQVQGVSFSIAEPAPLLDEARRKAVADARRKAVADARRKAELYAKEAGVEVGRVLLIQEQTPHLPGPLVLGITRAEAAGVPIAEGELDFGATITVTYAIGATTFSTRGGDRGER
jgi:uncharacterized protein YggE/DNA polymerase/3'-5' exonuclease PolX